MAEKHFYEQEKYANEYLIPFLKERIDNFHDKQIKILEVGCAEGGSIKALQNKGYTCDGVEISSGRVDIAKDKLGDSADIILGDITKPETLFMDRRYDLIIMRDVIEHIVDKGAAFDTLNKLLKEQGHLFITFPLKYSPYAGHQQTAKSWLKYIFYILLFPPALIRWLSARAKEPEIVAELSYLKKCALTYNRLKKLLKREWKIDHVDFFISRPVYKQRFGWPIVKMPKIPLIKEMANGCEAIIKKG